MAHFHIKTKKGRPYLYVREIARVGGKPTVVSQVYIGSPERVAGLVGGAGEAAVKLKVEEFGALWLALLLNRDIDLVGMIDQVVPRGVREEARQWVSISCIVCGTGCARRRVSINLLNGMSGRRCSRFALLRWQN